MSATGHSRSPWRCFALAFLLPILPACDFDVVDSQPTFDPADVDPLVLAVEVMEEAPAQAEPGTVRAALEECLVGRRAAGSSDVSRFPEYNLGYGYTCDSPRSSAYKKCMGEERPEEECLAEAEAARTTCLESPCQSAYNSCVYWRPWRTWNSWSNYKRIAGELVFGYYDWGSTGWGFHPVEEGDRVPEDAWTARCEAAKTRCELGLAADAGAVIPPADESLVSVAVYGHNCHHAAESVCKCVAEKTDDAAPEIIVLDGGVEHLIPKPGNLYHSYLEVNHPETEGKRCLVETQWRYASYSIDDRCCYDTSEEVPFDDLVAANCSLVLTGPQKKPRSVKPKTRYSCDNFLDTRGVGAAEVPSTVLATRDL